MVTGNPVNPFQPPAPGADVVNPSLSGGSLEKAIAGDYDFEIGDVMNEAWSLTNGFKATFWGGAIFAYVIIFGVFFVVSSLSAAIMGSDAGFIVGIAVNIASMAVTAPLLMGVVMLGVKRAAGSAVSAGRVVGYLDKTLPAAGASVLTTLLTYVGAIFLILPGIYLGLAYGLTMPLIADRNLPVWEAMETSRKALTHKWFRIFGLYLVVGLATIASAIPLGIGLIWTVPWSIAVVGVLYRRIFGTAAAAPGV